MSVAPLLRELRVLGIELEVVDGRVVLRAPKGALTADLAQRLRERKADILAFLQEGLAERGGATIMPPIRPVPRQEYMPLAFAQERLWYLNQVDQNPAVYNLPLAMRLVGSVRQEVLARCLDVLEARHESLRTTIVVKAGQAFQRIHAPRGLPLAVIDLRPGFAAPDALSPTEVLGREAMAPFDLAVAPLCRATLIRTADDEQYFIVVFHHVIADGISTQIFLRELVALYEAFLAGQPSPLPPLTIQFADLAAWQRDWFQGAALAEQLAYWKERLGGQRSTLSLPTDFPRPPLRTANGSKLPLRLPGSLVARLTTVGREEGATVYMVLLALFKTLLYRYSGSEDVILGTPVADRTRKESEHVLGFLANTLVLRTRLDGAPTFREVVRRVRDSCIGAFRHHDMPLQRIVEAVNPVRDLSRTPIFQAFFAMHEITSQPGRMADLTIEPVVADTNVSQMELALFLREVDDDVMGLLEYNTDLFARATIVRMAKHYVELAHSAAAEPDRRIADLGLLTDEDRHVLATWNATSMPCPDGLVHQLIETQARSTPDRQALRAEHASLSYLELERRATGLAHLLRARGVKPGDLVGVCLERSVELVPALLAVLKTGAAYVPMDADYPQLRLTFMAEDARLAMVLTQHSLLERLPRGSFATVCIEAAVQPDVPSESALESWGDPDSLAYVIYTSGSTGQPKGVEVQHRNVVNFLVSMRERPGMGEQDVLVAVTTLSFDIAVLELLLPLTVGAQVIVASREVATDGVALARLLRDTGATMMQATPATWRLLLDSGWVGQPGLKVLVGGEALPVDLAKRLFPLVGELWNMYGPTETTVWSTCTRVADPALPLTIGKPIGNTTVRVIGSAGQRQPIGVAGELFIGGAGVAKGYLGRPELTRERFVSDPIGQDAAGMFYRTGDLVRLLAHGELEFMGRIDSQVKVQGFRIELGEIETQLARLPEVREAVVSVRSHDAGDARLVAYVVFHAGRLRRTGEVRNFLRERLPDYMVPGVVVALDALPRTLNNKIDRSALPDPAEFRQGLEGAFASPRSEVEVWLASTWASLLHLARVGIHEDFFELGGQSLLAPRMIARVAAHFGIDVPLRHFLRAPTVAGVAEYIEARRYVQETAATPAGLEQTVI